MCFGLQVLPKLKRYFTLHPGTATLAIVAVIRKFILLQIAMAQGHEDELAAIVEETESVHRPAFRDVLGNLYKEVGCEGLLKRTRGLSARLEDVFDGEPPKQTAGELAEVYNHNNAIHVRAAQLAAAVAQKTGCKTFKAAPQKSIVRVVEKVGALPRKALNALRREVTCAALLCS